MPTDREALLQLLAEHGAACPGCGYNLRGVQDTTCPECGRAFSFGELVCPSRQVDWAWLIALMALSVALVESSLKWQRLLVRRLPFYSDDMVGWTGSPEPHLWVMAAFSYAFWLSVPLALLGLIVWRRRFERLPLWTRWSLAGLVLLLVVLGHRRLIAPFWWIGVNQWLTPNDSYGPPWPHWWMD